ncbi:MAG: hypothetical protein WD810_02405 [Solirubrobacterales bacterium]
MAQIENPAAGERIVFVQTAAETGGELLEMDDFWTHTDHRTPEHVHPEMEERLFALFAGDPAGQGPEKLAALLAEFRREVAPAPTAT